MIRCKIHYVCGRVERVTYQIGGLIFSHEEDIEFKTAEMGLLETLMFLMNSTDFETHYWK